MSDHEEEQEQERSRPRVVDKRVSSGGHTPPPRPETAAEPAPTETAPVGEPARGGATEERSDEPRGREGNETAAAEPRSSGSPQGAGPTGPGGEVWTPEEEAEAMRMAQEIAERPSIDWVVNAAVTMANVAATKLQVGDPVDAQLAIDALAGILNATAGRLDDAEAPLKQTLAQLQLAYAQRLSAPPPQPPGA